MRTLIWLQPPFFRLGAGQFLLPARRFLVATSVTSRRCCVYFALLLPSRVDVQAATRTAVRQGCMAQSMSDEFWQLFRIFTPCMYGCSPTGCLMHGACLSACPCCRSFHVIIVLATGAVQVSSEPLTPSDCGGQLTRMLPAYC